MGINIFVADDSVTPRAKTSAVMVLTIYTPVSSPERLTWLTMWMMKESMVFNEGDSRLEFLFLHKSVKLKSPIWKYKKNEDIMAKTENFSSFIKSSPCLLYHIRDINIDSGYLIYLWWDSSRKIEAAHELLHLISYELLFYHVFFIRIHWWVSAKRRNSSALAMELRLSCTNPSTWWYWEETTVYPCCGTCVTEWKSHTNFSRV